MLKTAGTPSSSPSVKIDSTETAPASQPVQEKAAPGKTGSAQQSTPTAQDLYMETSGAKVLGAAKTLMPVAAGVAVGTLLPVEIPVLAGVAVGLAVANGALKVLGNHVVPKNHDQPWTTTQRLVAAVVSSNEGDPHAMAMNGMLLNGRGELVPYTSRLEEVEPVRPPQGASTDAPILYVNGILWTKDLQQDDLQMIASQLGRNFVGMRHASQNVGADLVRCLTDKLGAETDAVSQNLRTILRERCQRGETTELIVWSRGALLANTALRMVKQDLVNEGCSPDEMKRLMSLIHVESWGGAVTFWEDGPQYVHLINRNDPICMFGMRSPVKHPGEGAKVVTFDSRPFPLGHMAETYVEESARWRNGRP